MWIFLINQCHVHSKFTINLLTKRFFIKNDGMFLTKVQISKNRKWWRLMFQLVKGSGTKFFKIKLVEWKVFKKKLFLDKRNVFQKKVDTFLKNTLKNLGFGTFRFLNFAIRSRQDDENGTLNNKGSNYESRTYLKKFHSLFK